MQHTIKQIASNFQLDYQALLKYAIINVGRYGIQEENGEYNTTTSFTLMFVEAFKNKDTAILQRQKEVLAACKCNDEIYAGGNPENDNFHQKFVAPIFDKTIEDIKFLDGHLPDIRLSQFINTKGKLYELYRIDGGNPSTLYVITIDKKIAYYKFCSIFRPASSAFQTLTEVYSVRYNNEIGSWIQGSLYEADCYSTTMLPTPFRKELFEKVENVDEFVCDLYTHY